MRALNITEIMSLNYAGCSDNALGNFCASEKFLKFVENHIAVTENGYSIYKLCLLSDLIVETYIPSERVLQSGEEVDLYSKSDYKAVFVKGNTRFLYKKNKFVLDENGDLKNTYFTNTDWDVAENSFFIFSESGDLTDLKVKNMDKTAPLKLSCLFIK